LLTRGAFRFAASRHQGVPIMILDREALDETTADQKQIL
jgi:hypothetical protein